MLRFEQPLKNFCICGNTLIFEKILGMPKRPVKTFFYQQAALLSVPEFNANADVHGFSVSYNQPFYEHDLFKFHFRSDFLTVILVVKGEITFSLNLEEYTAKKKQPCHYRPPCYKESCRGVERHPGFGC